MNQINQNQFNEWLEHPATEIFFNFLKDSIKQESARVTEIIISGGRINEYEQIESSTLCFVLKEIVGVTSEDINEFYEKE